MSFWRANSLTILLEHRHDLCHQGITMALDVGVQLVRRHEFLKTREID
jgi:hypothetical protein